MIDRPTEPQPAGPRAGRADEGRGLEAPSSGLPRELRVFDCCNGVTAMWTTLVVRNLSFPLDEEAVVFCSAAAGRTAPRSQPGEVQLTLVRNATLVVAFGGRRILVYPMLDEAGARPPVECSPNRAGPEGGRRGLLVCSDSGPIRAVAAPAVATTRASPTTSRTSDPAARRPRDAVVAFRGRGVEIEVPFAVTRSWCV